MRRFDFPSPWTERGTVHASLVSFFETVVTLVIKEAREYSLARAHCEFSGLYAAGPWEVWLWKVVLRMATKSRPTFKVLHCDRVLVRQDEACCWIFLIIHVLMVHPFSQE